MFMNKTLAAASILSALAVSSAQGAAVIYEPFDFDTGNLSGNGTAAGLSGNWGTDGRYDVYAGSLTFGALQTDGNRMGAQSNTNGGMKRVRTAISSALSNNGLLDNDGNTDLWFSFLYQSTNVSNDEFGFALAEAEWSPGLNALSGGVGVAVNSTGTMTARFWDGNNYAGTTSGSLSSVNDGTTRLIVGHIEWGVNGSTVDTLRLYAPDADLDLTGHLISTATYDATQADYDTLTTTTRNNNLGSSSLGHSEVDEIRFGEFYSDVTPVPEPGSLALLSLGGLMIARRRRG